MFIIKKGYILRTIVDTHIVVGIGAENYAPTAIMSVNETGAFLWNELEKGASEEQLLDKLCEEYEVDRETAQSDIAAFIEQLTERGIVTEC